MPAPKIKLQKPIDVVISDVQIMKQEIAELKLAIQNTGERIKKMNIILTGEVVEDKVDTGWWWS
jgi:hypothetical protein